MTDGVIKRLPVKRKDGSIDLIEIEGIFYLEAKGHDTLIRTKRKKPYHSVQRLGEIAKKLPAPAFVRCHNVKLGSDQANYLKFFKIVLKLPPK